MELYTFFRSSAAYRVRIALNLKGIAAREHYVHLRRSGGEQKIAPYLDLNPQALVPVVTDGGFALTQSLAIIEYIDEIHPDPPLLPSDPKARALARSFALAIACDIHPLNNLAVLEYLRHEMKVEKDGVQGWYRNWVGRGFDALEMLLAGSAACGRFCHGDAPGLADICLVPQVFNARRFDCDLAPYPTLMRVFEACMTIEAFDGAQADRQPDAN